MKNTIVYNLVESNVNRMYENMDFGNNYYYVDKVELEEELEFVNKDSLLIYSYDISSKDEKDENDYYLVIIVEEVRILYLILDNNYKVLEEYIMKDEELNDSMYC